jgi:Mrp family chromosome partitioning ATPase
MAGVMGALLSELFSGRAMRRTNFAPNAIETQREEPIIAEVEAFSETPAVVAPSLLGKRKTVTAPSIDPADLVPIDQRVDSVANELVASGCQRAIFISPEGDPGAAGAVMIARRMADDGMNVVVIDLTTSAIATRTMLDDATQAGLTNLLCGDASLAECISQDLYSDALIVARGNASSAKAMRNSDRLPEILNRLNETCEILVIECGAADLAMLDLVVSDDLQNSIIVSAVKADGPATMEVVDALGGAEAVMRVTPLLKQRRAA